MNHSVFGKKLSRDTGQRQALLKGLAGAMIRSEAIETTEAKAKAAASMVEKLVTLARRANLNDIRQIEALIINKELVSKLVHAIAPRFKTQPGGYVRLIKLGTRAGDNAAMVRMEFVTPTVVPAPAPKAKAAPKAATKAKK